MMRPSLALQLPKQMTVALWVKPSEAGETGILLSAGGSGSTRHVTYQWELALESGKVRFTTSPDGAARNTLSSPDAVGPGSWAHIVAGYDGTHRRIWINGQEVASKRAEEGLHVVPLEQKQPICLGIDPSRYGSYYEGLMDEVMIFNQALTAEKVGRLYSGVY